MIPPPLRKKCCRIKLAISYHNWFFLQNMNWMNIMIIWDIFWFEVIHWYVPNVFNDLFIYTYKVHKHDTTAQWYLQISLCISNLTNYIVKIIIWYVLHLSFIVAHPSVQLRVPLASNLVKINSAKSVMNSIFTSSYWNTALYLAVSFHFPCMTFLINHPHPHHFASDNNM